MPETAPNPNFNPNAAPKGTQVMMPGYHKRWWRRYSRRHQPVAQPAGSFEPRPKTAESKSFFRGSSTMNILKRMARYLNMAAQFKRGDYKQQAGQIAAKAAVKKIVRKP